MNTIAEMIGEKLRFHKGKDGVLLVSGMTIDAIELFNDETSGHPVTYRLLSYTTGSPPTVVVSSVRPEDQRLRSVCAPYRPFCGKCNNNVQSVNSEVKVE